MNILLDFTTPRGVVVGYEAIGLAASEAFNPARNKSSWDDHKPDYLLPNSGVGWLRSFTGWGGPRAWLPGGYKAGKDHRIDFNP